MSTPSAIVAPRDGVVLLSGYGIRVAVERGHLRVEDGVGADRRCARFARADRELRRLVVLGHSGTISFDALRWLSDVGAGFVQIDNDGRVIAAAGPTGLNEARLGHLVAHRGAVCPPRHRANPETLARLRSPRLARNGTGTRAAAS